MIKVFESINVSNNANDKCMVKTLKPVKKKKIKQENACSKEHWYQGYGYWDVEPSKRLLLLELVFTKPPLVAGGCATSVIQPKFLSLRSQQGEQRK